jgi:hypothetical protein
MTEQAARRIMETYHRKAMREPTKRLRAAIEQASKKRCWYDGWKHEGDRADYGILFDPMRDFLLEAQFNTRWRSGHRVVGCGPGGGRKVKNYKIEMTI